MGVRRVSVPASRLERWLAGFADRHGHPDVTIDGDTVALVGGDGDRAWLDVPFGPLAATGLDDVLAHVAQPRRVAALLVRRGGYAAGVFDGEELLVSKVGSRHVQGTTKAGGWSQQRFARRRANQAEAAFAAAADAAVRVFPPGERFDALVAGGDRAAVDTVLADQRLGHLPAPSGSWLDVHEPKRRVLEALPEQFAAITIRLDP